MDLPVAGPSRDGVGGVLARHRTLVAVGLALLLQLIVFSLVYPNLWYGAHDISDITIYFAYAAKIASG
jgi:hypothetical protein